MSCDRPSLLICLFISIAYCATLLPNEAITKVHVVFMTHLDVGYTLPSSIQVLDEYFTKLFPMAYNTSEVLRKRNGEEKFVWTTHPWLLMAMLNNLTGNVTPLQIQQLEEAIQRSDGTFDLQANQSIAHSFGELSHFSFGLDLARQLDERFNKTRKICGSQKDVPGSTRGVVKLMAGAGIKALHVGVNDFCRPPAVPHTSPILYKLCNPFVWKDPESGSELICFWCSGYSESPWGMIPELVVQIPGMNEVLVFLMRVDNTGPQPVEDVITGWNAVKQRYPNAKVVASSLDDFTEAVLPYKHTLDVVTEDLGDTWIYGISSDPFKIKAYREMARQRAQALEMGSISLNDSRVQNFSRMVLKLPEHTWGYNEGGLQDNWDNAYFDANFHYSDFQTNLRSFLEQRFYVQRALEALEDLPLRKSIEEALQNTEPAVPSLERYEKWTDYTSITKCGDVAVAFNQSGAIVKLTDSHGNSWATPEHPLGLFRYNTHSEKEFQTYVETYMNEPCRSMCGGCSFSKCNLTNAGATTGEYVASTTSDYAWRDVTDAANGYCRFLFNLTLPTVLQKKYGAPPTIFLQVALNASTTSMGNSKSGTMLSVLFDVEWLNKRPTRMAESIWMSFHPLVKNPEGWRLHKLGEWISPYDVVVNGSRTLHGVWDGVRCVKGDGKTVEVSIESPDAPLVSPGLTSPIAFGKDAEPQRGMNFNLFNNAWSTNYPQWTMDPGSRFRFWFHTNR